MDANNYYEALELKPQASQEEVYKAYTRSKNAYSEESLALYSLMSKEECSQMLDSIEEAYSVLSEPSKRSEYDRVRGFRQTEAPIKQETQLNAIAEVESKDAHKFERYSTRDNAKATKITALSKFSLDYEHDVEMEARIDNQEVISGQFLREIREYKGVSLARLSEISRISQTYLNHIENDRFDELPAPAYVRGFAFQIARCLKLNPDHIARAYIKHMNELNQMQ